ncbi:hypothetical protein TNCV_5067351 [Trichonephila clavipes]|nr:hypothetical protein TNCV_5067351 [Trichonephila clavipes]
MSIDTPTLSLTLCQLDKCCIALLLSDCIQISFLFGRDAREPRASSMAISSLRKADQPSGFLRYGLLRFDVNSAARSIITVSTAIRINLNGVNWFISNSL